MKTKAIIVALLASASFTAHAQQDPLASQYMFNELPLNPAYAGTRNDPNVTATFRKQWANLDGAPVTQTISYDQKLKQKMGLGIVLLNDKIGVTGQTDFYANYAYHLKLGNALNLSLGLRGGVSNYRANLTKLQVWDQGDATFSQNIVKKWLPNFGTGAFLYAEKFYGGISIPHMLNYDPSTFMHAKLSHVPMTERHYYIIGGAKYDINQKFSFDHSILFKVVPGAPAQLDINTIAYYKKMFGIGISYRTRDGIVALAQFCSKDKIKIGYAFDYSFSALANYTNGSHEIMLSYNFAKESSPASFSK